MTSASPSLERKLHTHVAHYPSLKSVSFQTLNLRYGAANFELELAFLILKLRNPMLTAQQLRQQAEQTTLPFRSVAVYSRVKFWNADAQGRDQTPETLDSAHAHPEITTPNGQQLPGRWDTVIVNTGDGADSGVEGKFILNDFWSATILTLLSRISCRSATRDLQSANQRQTICFSCRFSCLQALRLCTMVFGLLTQSRQQLSDVQDLSLVQGRPSSCLHHPYRRYTTQRASYPQIRSYSSTSLDCSFSAR